MGNIVSLFRGQVSLNESGVSVVEGLIQREIGLVVREEIRPARDLLASNMVALQTLQDMVASYVVEMQSLRDDIIKELRTVKIEREEEPAPVAKKVSGLVDEKKGDEILATLFDKMKTASPSRLRPFYTDLENAKGINLSAIHKARTKDISSSENGKFPYRKIDTALMLMDAEELFAFAKSYVFRTE